MHSRQLGLVPRVRVVGVVYLVLAILSGVAAGTKSEAVVWHSDYASAVRQAQREKKLLLIHFMANSGLTNQGDTAADRFERVTLSDPRLANYWGRHVCVRLPLDTPQPVLGTRGEGLPAKHMSAATNGPQRLIDHPAFAYMRRQPGLAIIDFQDPASPYWHQVTTQLPFAASGYPDVYQMTVILTLPTASLTQRTMIYAVRTHGEFPESASGTFDPLLAREAEKHSQLQANLRVQGHHQWDRRFQQISYQLPHGLTAQEVCAESWPQQDLVEAAIDCVDSWRQSPGHWSAVRRRQPRFAFDLKRGVNGIWYATGLFGNRGG